MYFQMISKIQKVYDKTVSLLSENEISLCSCISPSNQEFILKIFEKKRFQGRQGEICEVSFLEEGQLYTSIFIGLGKKEILTKNILRESLYQALKGETGHFLITAENDTLVDTAVFAEMAEHINYCFDRYKTRKKDKFLFLDYFSKTNLVFPEESTSLATISSHIRNMINEPAEYMTPERLAMEAQICAEKYNFSAEILDEHKAERLGMQAFLSVGKAAANRPKVIVMRYFGDPDSTYKTALVGKGLCYDSGCLSLNPETSIFHIKDAMSGAATVIGIISAAAHNKIKQNIVGVIAACENSIGTKSFHPGDIIRSMNGKTIEITNTHTEGRLTLADAITYSIRVEKADALIDIATLTGAMVLCLGKEACAVFTHQQESYQALVEASQDWREMFWQMPLFEVHKKTLQSDIADLKNSNPKETAASFAAKFLEEFVEGKPWLHLDVAGTCYSEKGDNYYPQGATGQVMRSVYSYLKNKKK